MAAESGGIFNLTRFANSVAVVTADREVSYSELDEISRTQSKALRAGDLVAIVGSNTFGAISAYVACQQFGCPVLLVDAQLDRSRMVRIFDRYQVSIAYTGAWSRLRAVGPRLHSELALLLSTSGSTGDPKFVRLSRSAMLANAQSIAEYLHLSAKDRSITSLPFHYSYGLSVVHSHLLVGGSIVVAEMPVTQREFWEVVRTRGVSNIAGVPVMYDWMRRLRIERMELPALRMLTQAGGRLAPESVLWWAETGREKGWEFFVMYGQTEATARMAYLPPKLAGSRPDSIGLPIPGGTFTLVDDGGEQINESEREGELVYAGANVMLGYAAEAADLALGDELGGVLHTGDVAVRDSEGMYRIVGRKSRFLKVFGKRLALDHLERLLADRGLTAIVTGRDDCVVVVASDAQSADAAAAAVAELAGVHRSVVNSLPMAETPRTSSGKLNYAEIIAVFDRHRQDAHSSGRNR